MKLSQLFEDKVAGRIHGFKSPIEHRAYSSIKHAGDEWAFTGKTSVHGSSKKHAFEYVTFKDDGTEKRIWITYDGVVYAE